ncbi:hypothetical protein FI206_23200 [Salmonella enterica subsp. enterica]|nr:hypothetical protein [Salmonella enterica subsp. enterica serovar Hessarek]ECA5091616.1 hypothetical protein [Salmonella enterica subsp. enterica serovar Menston]
MFTSINEIILFKESGISTDINVFFRDNDNILSYEISSNKKGYIVNVKLVKKDRIIEEDLFFSLIRFLKYSHISCYQKNIKENCVEYEYITANEEMRGFYCCITFK